MVLPLPCHLSSRCHTPEAPKLEERDKAEGKTPLCCVRSSANPLMSYEGPGMASSDHGSRSCSHRFAAAP